MHLSNAFLLISSILLFSYTFPILEINGQAITNHDMAGNNTTSLNISENLTTYQNSEMGFQIQHPIGWKVEKKPFAVETVEIIPNKSDIHHTGNDFFFTVSRENVSDGLLITLNSITERNINLAKSLPNFTSVESNKTVLGGSPAHMIKYNFTSTSLSSEMVFQTLNIWTMSEDKIYTISYTTTSPSLSLYQNIVETMINSFKIIK